MCGRLTERTCNDGNYWIKGICSMRCYFEKEWRGVLSVMNKPYRPDPRDYDDRGYPVDTVHAAETARGAP